jgi:hypothetical protein
VRAMPPRLARLLAAVVAIALVAAAFVARGALSGDDGDGPTGAGPDATAEPGSDGDETFQVICDADLGEATCDAVEASPGVDVVEILNADEVGSAPPEELAGYDAWLTVDPLPAVVDAARFFADLPPFTTEGARLEVASSPLSLLVFDDTRLDCPDPATWDCLVEPVRPGVAVPDPATSMGTVALAAGAAGLLDDTGFGIDGFRDSPARDELADLLEDVDAAAGGSTARQTASMLVPGTASGAVTTADLAAGRADTVGGRGRGLRSVPLTPAVTVGIVLVGLGAGGADAVGALGDVASDQTVLDALAEAGWAGEPAASSGLPAPDVIDAMREDLGR